MLAQYKDDTLAEWAYTKALVAFRDGGGTAQADKLLMQAVKANKHIPAYLLGHKQPPHDQPPYINMGGEDEAFSYAVGNRRAWLNTPGTISWLRKTLDVPLPRAPKPRRGGLRGPNSGWRCGAVRKSKAKSGRSIPCRVQRPAKAGPRKNHPGCDGPANLYSLGNGEHCGNLGGRIRLRELVTDAEYSRHNSLGYLGRPGELWYLRLCPPLVDSVDYHVAVTTPYILTETSKADWTAYLNRAMLSLGGQEEGSQLHALLKHGLWTRHWSEFIFWLITTICPMQYSWQASQM